MNTNKTEEFTIQVFTENQAGILNRLTILFTRRKINIESITASESHIEGIHCIIIVVNSEESRIRKLVVYAEKLVDVIKVFYFRKSQIIYQEIALYKVPTDALISNSELEKIIRQYSARIMEMTPKYTIIEKTGHKDETQELLEKLSSLNLIEFVRSGRVAISRANKDWMTYADDLEKEFKNAKTDI